MANPLDLIEQVIAANEWAFDRRNEEEMAVEIDGHWCQYHLWFTWQPDSEILHVSCALDIKIPSAKRRAIPQLLAKINEKIWLGHFEVWRDEGLPVFRYALLLRGSMGATVEQIEDLVDIAIGECERFYPAFQFVIWGGKSADEALEAALLETVGEA